MGNYWGWKRDTGWGWEGAPGGRRPTLKLSASVQFQQAEAVFGMNREDIKWGPSPHHLHLRVQNY